MDQTLAIAGGGRFTTPGIIATICAAWSEFFLITDILK
jgi:hypothetical protein